jgi:hypothetical protein
VKLTASVAALLLASTAMAQTATPAAPATPDTAAPAPATPPPAAAAPAPAPVAAPAPAPAPAPAAAPAAPAFKFALHGFVSMSAAYQSGAFILSEGQQSLGSATGVSAAGVAGSVPDKNSLTFDVRQSRFNFSVTGPQVLGGATPSAVMELDFFQGFGAGNYGDVSLLNRLRVAYTELNWGAHRLQFGQQNDLVFAMAPTSISHIAFPLGYYTGNIGWRRPGVFGYHTFQLPNEVKVEGAWEVGRAQWTDASDGGAAGVTIGGAAANQPGKINLGEASGAPAVEGRVTLSYAKFFTAFAGAHWQQIDAGGYGGGAALGTSDKHTMNTTAYNGGVKIVVPVQGDVALTVQGTGFSGKNVGPLIANMTTSGTAFKFGPNGEDVSTTGYWGQAGLNLTKEFSVWGFYGNQAIDKKDFATAKFNVAGAAPAAYENTTTNLLAMYREGGIGFSAEWINFQTKYATAGGTSAAAPITASATAKSDQYMFTANYFF